MGPKIITIGMLSVFLLWSCAAIQKDKTATERIIPDVKSQWAGYAAFVKENIAEINATYSMDYAPYDFIVDTDYGSTVIQNLLDQEAAAVINTALIHALNPENSDQLQRIYQHIISHYDYIVDPIKWQSVAETIRTRKGDCKNLSLLLMSSLTRAGYDAYAGISNGHMWVKVKHHNRWQVLELDQNPTRKEIYNIPGFYDNPLYKIYFDRSEKRKRMN